MQHERICDFRDGRFRITYTEMYQHKERVGELFTWTDGPIVGYNELAEWVDAEWNTKFMYFTDAARVMLKLL